LRETTPSDAPGDRPSKSQRKRDAHALQELAVSLVDLADSELARIPMPDELRDAVLETRRMTARGALARQRQYLGRLMREIDPDPIRDALDEIHARGHAHVARFHRLERWRDRLLDEGDTALEELLAEHPQLDAQYLRSLVREGARERRLGHSPRASRALFRYLREQLESA
jgi:ribosome-associated protein